MTPEEMATRIQALETQVQQLQAYRHRADANTRTLIHWIAQAYARHLGISYTTAWRMWKRGELTAHQLPSGTVIVEEAIAKDSSQTKSPQVVVYTRVSSTENKANLETQAERVISYCNAKGWSVSRVVKECGSGINDQRPKFLARLSDPTISHIVVEHKDRASRFGVAYIQTLLTIQGRELVVVNRAETAEEDLMSDLVSIITSFCARLYGRRRARHKTKQVLRALQQEGA